MKDDITVRCEECLVCSDLHIPGHSTIWLNKLIAYAQKNNIKTLFVGGDLLHLDALSDFEVKDDKYTLKHELEMAEKILEKLTDTFKSVYLITGNHDHRLPRAMKQAITYAEWIKTICNKKNLVVTNYDYIRFISGGRRYRVCHPSIYSRIKGNVVNQLSNNYQENILCGHSHYMSLATNANGKYVCVDTGSLCDKTLFAYKRSRTTKFPDWINCFLHIKQGKVRVISDFTF